MPSPTAEEYKRKRDMNTRLRCEVRQASVEHSPIVAIVVSEDGVSVIGNPCYRFMDEEQRKATLGQARYDLIERCVALAKSNTEPE